MLLNISSKYEILHIARVFGYLRRCFKEFKHVF